MHKTNIPYNLHIRIVIDMGESTSLAKWSSLELLAEEDDSPPPATRNKDDSIFSHSFLQRVASERGSRRPTLGTTTSIDRGQQESPPSSPGLPSCATSVLVLVVSKNELFNNYIC